MKVVTQFDKMLGTDVDVITNKSCEAIIGTGEDWATVYMIGSDDKNRGHATELLTFAKQHYESQGKKFGSSVALTSPMKHLLKKLNIYEYTDEQG